MSCENHETVSNITICTNLEARILMRIESARLEPKSQSNLDSILGTLKESKRPMGLSEKRVPLHLMLHLAGALLWE